MRGMRGMGQAENGQPNLGPLTPYHPPNIQDLVQYNVNRAGQPEVIWQPLYDYQSYAMAGATQFTFFQRSVGSSGTTYADTNMTVGGMLPRPQEFLITGIQVFFKPAGAVNRSALAAATVLENWNDINDIIFGSSFLKLFIGSKDYLVDGPIGKFPPVFGIGGAAAYMGTTTADMNGRATDYAKAVGKYYSITPVKIPANQNFNVSLNFPTAIAAAASGNTIGVILDGFLYRLSQ